MSIAKVKTISAAISLLCLLMLGAGAARAQPAGKEQDGKVEHPPISMKVGQEFGQLARFKLIDRSEKRWEWMDRFSVLIGKDVIIDDRILVSAGFAGTYLMVMPENISNGFTGSLYRRSYIGPSHGFMQYHFGGIQEPVAKLRLGLFPYKYNPEAANLGEYLFRSMAYPTVVYTGGLSPTMASGAMIQGAELTGDTGPFSHSLFLTTETTISPFSDFSLSYLGDARFGGTRSRPVLTLGAGASWISALPVARDKTSPQIRENAYFKKNGTWYSGYSNFYADSATWFANLSKAATARGDSTLAASYATRGKANEDLILNIRSWLDRNDSLRDSIAAGRPVAPNDTGLLDVKHYTFESVKLMGRFTFDPKPLLGLPFLGDEDLKIYGEAAVLGVKDYPVFYDDISQRIPVMLGVNLPAFNLLDLVSLQVERFPTRNPVSTFSIGTTASPLPGSRVGNEGKPGSFYDLDVWSADDLKWSLHLRKHLAPGFTVYGQVARDHFRTFSFNNSYAHGTDPGDVLVKKNHWYWTVNMVYGL